VVVDVTIEKNLSILSMAGLHSTTVHGHGEATGVSGISSEGDF